MVLIFTIDNDPSVNYVSNWLDYYKIPWRRINSKVKFLSDKTTISISNQKKNQVIPINDKKNDFSQFKSVWYRRTPEYEYFDFKLNCNPILKSTIEKNILNEANSLYSYHLSTLHDKYSLGNPAMFSLNKINQLEVAQECGLNIPDTIITNNRDDVKKFYKEHNKIIIKPLQNITFHQVKNKYFIPYTKLLNKTAIDKLPISFKPCLLQKYIEKKFEIRSFYLSGKFYSMAIFSQGNKQTSVDFRVYDEKLPNRVVPYKLPKKIEIKLHSFMKKYKLNTGSFDLIHSNTNEFVFLEVNPVGQFGMVSYPCNYFLERKIVQNLIQM